VDPEGAGSSPVRQPPNDKPFWSRSDWCAANLLAAVGPHTESASEWSGIIRMSWELLAPFVYRKDPGFSRLGTGVRIPYGVLGLVARHENHLATKEPGEQLHLGRAEKISSRYCDGSGWAPSHSVAG
jgi:hypothetical protein